MSATRGARRPRRAGRLGAMAAAAFVIASVIAVAVGGWIGTTFADLGVVGAEAIYLAVALCVVATVAAVVAIVRRRRRVR